MLWNLALTRTCSSPKSGCAPDRALTPSRRFPHFSMGGHPDRLRRTSPSICPGRRQSGGARSLRRLGWREREPELERSRSLFSVSRVGLWRRLMARCTFGRPSRPSQRTPSRPSRGSPCRARPEWPTPSSIAASRNSRANSAPQILGEPHVPVLTASCHPAFLQILVPVFSRPPDVPGLCALPPPTSRTDDGFLVLTEVY